MRQDRWARGDWQLLPWIIGRSPDTNRAPIHASIPLIGRWKMLDNLRRTLFAPAAFVNLIALDAAARFAFDLDDVRIGMYRHSVPYYTYFLDAMPHRRGISKRSHARAVTTDLGLAASHVGLTVTLLADQAWLMTDAIMRTLLRVYVTRKKLLEW